MTELPRPRSSPSLRRTRHGRVGSAHRAVRSRGAHPRARSGGRLPRDGRGHARPLPAGRGAACAAHGPDGDRDRRGRARARTEQRGCAAARGLVFAARGARHTGKVAATAAWYIRSRHGGDAGRVAAAGLCDRERVGRGAAAHPGVGGGQGSARARCCCACTKPRFVPRLALRRGIPPEGRTLVRDRGAAHLPRTTAHALCARLEEYCLVQPRRG
ncbi:MAG: hypothetical protein ACLUNO_07775 [Oscillospiraceae bacterium]